jgi:hypothetical protein
VGRKKQTKKNFIFWLYDKIYDVRCDFLHGNPVKPGRLKLDRSKRALFDYAAPLYRLALTGFLPLSWNKPVPSTDDTSVLGSHI